MDVCRISKSYGWRITRPLLWIFHVYNIKGKFKAIFQNGEAGYNYSNECKLKENIFRNISNKKDVYKGKLH